MFVIWKNQNRLKSKADEESQNVMLEMELKKNEFNEKKQLAIVQYKV